MIELKVSCHQIVDFLFRKGDIDDRVFNVATMLEGTSMHKYYQARQGEGYISEVYLKETFIVNNYKLTIDGRADGVLLGKEITIDEIKTTNTSLEEFYTNNKEWHLAQAEIYALIYCIQHNLDRININLTYLSQVKKDVLKKKFTYEYNDLYNKVYKYLEDYVGYLDVFNYKKIERDNSLKDLSFPFNELRSGQDKLIKSIKESIDIHDPIFIEAATGIGKTVSTLYGGIQEIKDKRIDKIFYATPKNSGFINALKAIELFSNKGIKLVVTQITGKEKMCLNSKKVGKCNPDDCPFAKNYYSKLKEILKETLREFDTLDENTIKDIAIKKEICPFEFSLDLTNYSDVIICDYNYIFDPIASLERYFINPDKDYRKLLLCDEAHNLVSRATDMFSASLNVSSFFACLPDLKKITKKNIVSLTNKLEEYFVDLSNFDFSKNDHFLLEDYEEEFIDTLKRFQDKFREYRRKRKKFKSSSIDNFLKDLYRFLLIEGCYKDNERYKTYIKKERDEISINVYCLDYSKYIKDRVYQFDGSIFFSATFSPIDYYMNRILGRKNIKKYIIKSPFSKDNFKVLVDPYISLIYKERVKTLPKVIKDIEEFVYSKVGNYLIFVPSFEYLTILKDKLKLYACNVIYQEKNMLSKDKENFLANFDSSDEYISNVGVCVLGGTFSEGIDLVGDKLIGVVVVGIGLPTVSFENQLKKQYFDSLSLDGYEYAYLNVGLNKVTQAVGRLIRSKDDKGMVLLIDKRFCNKTYNDLFANQWSNNIFIKDSNQIKKNVKDFYSK